jgi:glucose/arabinose dehydrogenase
VPRRLLTIAVLALAAAAALPAPTSAAPPGQLVASGIPFATNVAFDRHGGMWVTSGAPFHQPGDGVWYVSSPGARPVHVIRKTLQALGLTWFRRRLYIASIANEVTGKITRYSGFDGRRFAHRRVIVPSLPVNLHALGTMVAGPGGRVYVGVGAEHDTFVGGHATSGTVVSFKGDGRRLRIEARGLRGPFGLAFIPGTRSLLVTDDGRDDLGDVRPPDELDLIPDVSGRAPDFGFPACSDLGGRGCAGTVAALVNLPPHAGVGGVAVARDWGGQGTTAFVAENGAVFADTGAGKELRQITLRPLPGGGYAAVANTVLASGFDDQDPLGVAIGPDGALYLTLFRTGAVVRFFPPPPTR